MPELTPAPPEWEDRARATAGRPEPLEERLRRWSDAQITSALGELTVVGFDPGETTGWAVMRVSADALLNATKPVHECIHYWTHGQVDTGMQMQYVDEDGNGSLLAGEAVGAAVMEQIVEFQFGDEPRAICVVFEDFILRTANKKREALSPVRVTARVEQLLWEANSVTLRKQQPGLAKGAIKDGRLKLWGMFHGGTVDRHARDADRHALYLLRDARAKRARAEAAFPVIAEARERGLL